MKDKEYVLAKMLGIAFVIIYMSFICGIAAGVFLKIVFWILSL